MRTAFWDDEHATYHFGNHASGIGAGHIRANIPARKHSRSRASGRHGLPEPPSAASKRPEWPARPGELWNSRPTESLPSAAAQVATDLSSEPRVIDCDRGGGWRPRYRRQQDRMQWDVAGRVGKGRCRQQTACVLLFEGRDWMQYADRPHETQRRIQRREFADLGLLHY
jgi:hypothetical protein